MAGSNGHEAQQESQNVTWSVVDSFTRYQKKKKKHVNQEELQGYKENATSMDSFFFILIGGAKDYQAGRNASCAQMRL